MIRAKNPRPALSLAAAKARRRARKLLRDVSGIAVIELAICLPPLLYMGMYGLELMNLAAVNLEVSQIALSLADNASRLGQTDNSGVAPTVGEGDVDSVMTGALKQGDSLAIETNGKIILSSLEKDKVTGKQYIHWQRCRGALNKSSAYGKDIIKNNGNEPTLAGMGSGTQKVTATSDSDTAVMFAEVYYKYPRLFGDFFLRNNIVIHREAAYLIRDDRDLVHDDTTGAPRKVGGVLVSPLTGTTSADDTCG